VKEALRREPFTADSVFLDGFEPHRNAAMWELHTLKTVARHCRRGTTVATWTVAGEVRRDLAQCGFSVHKAEGLAPKRQCLQGAFEPSWEPKNRRPAADVTPGRCVVVGCGLAGAAAAASLARRGWRVTVLDAADSPAAGASSVPVALLAPHFSPDDNLLSRLSRSGVRATLQQARALLREAVDWRATGALEHRTSGSHAAAADTSHAALAWSRQANDDQKISALLEQSTQGLWHEQAAWIKPAVLVRAWLEQAGVAWQGKAKVDRIVRDSSGWQLVDAHGHELARAELVVVAAAHASAALLEQELPLLPVRGQVSWAEQEAGQRLPPFPVNGNGHFIAQVPLGDARAWFCGSTFDRGDTDTTPRPADHAANLERLRALLPAVAQQLEPAFAAGSVNAWAGIRCASSNRRPLLGEVQPGLWVSTAMGSRGLTFAVVCAELLAARLHGEPLPLELKLADALDPCRTGNFSLDRNN